MHFSKKCKIKFTTQFMDKLQQNENRPIDKATDEYKKYKVQTLITVEEDYLNLIKMLEKKTDKKH